MIRDKAHSSGESSFKPYLYCYSLQPSSLHHKINRFLGKCDFYLHCLGLTSTQIRTYKIVSEKMCLNLYLRRQLELGCVVNMDFANQSSGSIPKYLNFRLLQKLTLWKLGYPLKCQFR